MNEVSRLFSKKTNFFFSPFIKKFYYLIFNQNSPKYTSDLFVMMHVSCRVIRIAPFANRLTMNVPSHIQLLRCITNYKALKFSQPISSLAEKLVSRMIERSSMTGGKYVSVHLRFEQVWC